MSSTTSLNIQTLPSKFLPFLINGNPNLKRLNNEIDEVFKTKLINHENRDYIYYSKNWIIKGKRTGPISTTYDTHLYRIRKSKKIKDYILKNNLSHLFIVPDKFLYWDEQRKMFFVISEKLQLAQAVAKPQSMDIKAMFIKYEPQFKGQCTLLKIGSVEKILSAQHAKALAEMSFLLGYTDQSYNNLFFSVDNRIAILDTEPLKRALKKFKFRNVLQSMFTLDYPTLLTQQALAGTTNLKLYCEGKALEEVMKIENKHTIKRVAILSFKIGTIVFSALFIFPLIICGTISKTLIVVISAFCLIKSAFLILNTIQLVRVWHLSYNQKILEIVQHERNGDY